VTENFVFASRHAGNLAVVSTLGSIASLVADDLWLFREIENWAHAAVANGAPVDEVVAEALKRIRNAPLPTGQPVATIDRACNPAESVEALRRAKEISSGRMKAVDLDGLMAASLRSALSDRR
jgi:hypothetical protein